MSFVPTSTNLANFISDTKGSEALAPLYITAIFQQLSHIHPNVNTSANAFLFTHNAQTYVVTSAHALFSESMSPDATCATEVRLGRTPLGNMAYSRFFDVAIFRPVDQIHASSYSKISAGDGMATAFFKDIQHPEIQFNHVANYTEGLNRRTKTGAFFYNLPQGSSGSAISRDGKLVAMVAGSDQKYENLTVCVPAQTIMNLITKIPHTYGWKDELNLDTLNIFPHMLTAPIPASFKSYFPDTALSHVVLYAKEGVVDGDGHQVLPLTIIESNVANKALVGQTKFAMKPLFDDRYFYFPREVVYGRYEGGNDEVTVTTLHYGLNVARSTLPNDVVWPGMNVIVDGHQINQKDWQDGVATIFPFSCMYYEYMNKDLTNEGLPLNIPQTLWTSESNHDNYDIKNSFPLWHEGAYQYYKGTANGKLYYDWTLKCLVRHWAFLVMSIVTNIKDAGNQFIVFAKECNRLKIIGDLQNNIINEHFLQTILNKIVEFVDLQALNFFFVLCKVFHIPKLIVYSLKRFFPIDNMNKATTNVDEWYDDGDNMKDTFTVDGNCSFNINGLESEHYHMIPNGAQSLTAQRGELQADTLGLNLELLYDEITRHQSISLDTWNEDSFHYYPESFEVVKSMWDHSHVTMANLLPELEDAFGDNESSVDVVLGVIPEALRAWPMLESKQAGGAGDSHLCTKLKEHGIVSEEEFQTITRAITPFAFANYRKELMVYFEFAPEVLEALETQGFDWAGLRGFAESMLTKVEARNLESAYTEWMQTILRLKEEAGQPIRDFKLLDVALSSM